MTPDLLPTHARIPVTVVIPTLNEGLRVDECVRAAAWADEILVCDGGSNDETPALAEAAGARILRICGRTIGAQRNAGIEAARNRWILALDVDERASPELVEEMRSAISSSEFQSFRIRFRNFYFGREVRHGRWAHDWHVRLFTRDLKFSEKKVHERLQMTERVGTLRSFILHAPYRDLRHHLEKISLYSRLGAEELYSSGRRATFRQLVFSPAWRFFRDYAGFGGWRDGRMGLVMALLSGFSTFSKYAALLELEIRGSGK